MKSVGIKLLKNKLSSYLQLVQKGEVVLVTDRDEVVAEIRRPRFNSLQKSLDTVQQFLADSMEKGVITKTNASVPIRTLLGSRPKMPQPIDAAELVSKIREERF